MTKTGHLSVQRGKRVIAIMRTGNHIIAKFKEHKGRFIHFYDHAPLLNIEIRTLSLFKPSTTKE